MSKTVSVALKAHYGQGNTTIARCWKVTRTDALILGFTNHDVDIPYLGVTYVAATGFTPSAVAGKLDLSVANLEVAGVLDSSSITEADLLGGKWDNADVEIFEVNYRDLTMGHMWLPGGKIGNVSAGRISFMSELRGISQALQQPVGEYYTRTCRANFGDARCTVNAVAVTVPGTVTAVTSRSAFAASALTQAADYFGAGVVKWLTGLNAGTSMEVNSFVGGAFVLAVAMPFNIAVGDTFSAVPGCRHRRVEDCKTKWNNIVNFRGFDRTPGNDIVLGTAGIVKSK